MKAPLFFSLVLIFSLIPAAWGMDADASPGNRLRKYSLDLETTLADVRRLAKGVSLGELSFKSKKTCKKPPNAPPDRQLRRVYLEEESYYLSEQSDNLDQFIHHIDLNGDGICDWLREAAESAFIDKISPDPRHFLFIGTREGWRYPDQTKAAKQRAARAAKRFKTTQVGRDERPSRPVDFMGFYEPLVAFVYQKNNPLPFLVTYTIWNPKVPNIDLSDFRTLRWNSKIDNFDDVPLKQHAAMLMFLHRKLCAEPKKGIIPGRDYSRIADTGEYSLCSEKPAPKKK